MIFLKRYLRYLGILPWVESRWKYIALICFLDGFLIFQMFMSVWFYFTPDQDPNEEMDSLLTVPGFVFILAWHLILLVSRKKYEVLLFDLEEIIQTSKCSSAIQRNSSEIKRNEFFMDVFQFDRESRSVGNNDLCSC